MRWQHDDFVIVTISDDMRSPMVKRARAFMGERVALVNSGDAQKARRLMSQNHVDDDAIETEAGERRNACAPEVMKPPRRKRTLPVEEDLAVKRSLGSREA